MINTVDINDFLMKKMNGDTSIGATPKILGIFIDSMYCYFTLEYVNLKAITYYIEKINDKEPIDKVVISEEVDSEMKKFLMTYFMKMSIPFTMINEFDKDSKAAMAVITRNDIQRNPLLYTPEIPVEYLKYFGKSICKNCYHDLLKIDPAIIKNYKKLPFFVSSDCPVCKGK